MAYLVVWPSTFVSRPLLCRSTWDWPCIASSCSWHVNGWLISHNAINCCSGWWATYCRSWNLCVLPTSITNTNLSMISWRRWWPILRFTVKSKWYYILWSDRLSLSLPNPRSTTMHGLSHSVGLIDLGPRTSTSFLKASNWAASSSRVAARMHLSWHASSSAAHPGWLDCLSAAIFAWHSATCFFMHSFLALNSSGVKVLLTFSKANL